MSYFGIEHSDHVPTDEELASETRQPPPRPARRDRQTDAAAWQRHIETTIRKAEHRDHASYRGCARHGAKRGAEHQKTIIALRAEIAELQLRCEAFEERQHPAKLIVFDKGAASNFPLA